jgi:transglutaminase-like putative cysteine protease
MATNETEALSLSLEVGCRFDYVTDADTPAVALVEPRSSSHSILLDAGWAPEPQERYEDLYGNVCRRLVLVPDFSFFEYHATVLVSALPEEMPAAGEVQLLIADLPSPLLHWLLPSRFCESDVLADRAWELFGDIPPTAARVQAVCDWIHDNIEYGVPTIPTTTTSQVLSEGGGMCRDMAHLGVAFCRALGIPARYVSGYLPDIGVPGSFLPEDFHAWFEVLLGNRWWAFDARFNVPRIGRVPIGWGRDAADVAMVTTYGPAILEQMAVWANVMDRESEAPDGP